MASAAEQLAANTNWAAFGKAEELAVRRFVDDYFLMIVVDGGDADLAGNHDVGMAIPIADFVDALARGEVLDFHLAGQDAEFVVVEE